MCQQQFQAEVMDQLYQEMEMLVLKNNQYTAPDIIDKFKLYTQKTNDNCIIWIAGKQKDGYGIVNYNGKSQLAHRAAYELFVANIPENMCVCHKCDNPGCVNPDHLFLGSHKDNMNDMKLKGRRKNIGIKEKNGRAKLTIEKANKIRLEKKQGKTLKELSIIFNVGISTIGRVCRMENWK